MNRREVVHPGQFFLSECVRFLRRFCFSLLLLLSAVRFLILWARAAEEKNQSGEGIARTPKGKTARFSSPDFVQIRDHTPADS
jgi:hypothetical protein